MDSGANAYEMPEGLAEVIEQYWYAVDDDGYILHIMSTPFKGCEPEPVTLPDGVALVDIWPDIRAYRPQSGVLTRDEEKIPQIRAAERAVMAETAYRALIAKQNERDKAREMIAATDDPDTLITLMPGMDEWDDSRTYARGECVTLGGMPYRAIHDIGEAHRQMSPDQSPTLWTLLHGRTRETALPYKQEGHNPYKAGERILWTDGISCECIQDTVHSPDAWPQGWRRDGESR